MKRTFAVATICLFLSGVFASGAANDITELVRKGLFEEEANHNLDAAMQAYQTAIGNFDQDRPLAATAIFRLGECYRKLGRTNEANAQYQRVIRDFPDQTQLVELSRGYLPQNQALPPPGPARNAGITSEEQEQFVKIQQMVRTSPDLLNVGGPDPGETPLINAAGHGWVQVARLLLDTGSNPNLRRWGWLPLCKAADSGNKEMVELLLDRGADVNARNDSGRTALYYAATNGYLAIAQTLLARHADPNLPGPDGDTPLYMAAKGGYTTVAKLLLKNGANINSTNAAGRTPLFAAILDAGQPSMVAFLLTNGATINIRDQSGDTPLQLASGTVRTQSIFRYADGGTPLQLASGNDEIEKLLLDAGASEDYPRLNSIFLTQAGTGTLGKPFFVKQGPDADEKHSLLELIAKAYGGKVWSGAVGFPDFEHVKVERLTREKKESITVNLAEILRSGDCSKDIPLQWGDVVEIPQLDHNLQEGWGGLPGSTISNLVRCEMRTIRIVVKGQTNEFPLLPEIAYVHLIMGVGPNSWGYSPTADVTRFEDRFGFAAAQFPRVRTVPNWPKSHLFTFDLNSVVRYCGLLLLSSDLTRVKVSGADGSVRKFNLQSQPPPHFILRDGDVIEIPEK